MLFRSVNIAGMSFGRDVKGGNAVSILNIDSEVPKKVMDEIRKAENIQGAKQIKL